jgi:hypothetical protein
MGDRLKNRFSITATLLIPKPTTESFFITARFYTKPAPIRARQARPHPTEIAMPAMVVIGVIAWALMFTITDTMALIMA